MAAWIRSPFWLAGPGAAKGRDPGVEPRLAAQGLGCRFLPVVRFHFAYSVMFMSSTAAFRPLIVVALSLLASGALAQERLQSRVLAAFRSVISEAAKSTAQVNCNGSSGSLGV